MFRRIAPLFLFAAAALPSMHAGELQLPDPVLTQSGARVTTSTAWETTRRPEVLELFRKHVYGRAPVGRPTDLKFEVFDSSADAMDGKATRKQIRISYGGPGGERAINLVLFTPNGVKQPAPCFLLICNRPAAENIDPTRAVKSPFWPAEEIVARGYAAAAFFNGDVVPDKHDGFKSGVFAIYDQSPRAADAWGTIAAWAWGASRALDYLVTDPAIDAKRVAVVGHSRGGKTALWAGAEDERFAMVVSNDSGCTGAALARGKTGERIRDINRGFPHWFDENYKAFVDREDELPLDQHMLDALIAPRLLYIASASEDSWADPKSEFLAAVHAGPVFGLFGLKGLASATMRKADAP
ncbi:MAG: prolyl oligopeptidase family serine peptidase, partial [Chthoniobacteraceae bacterium]